MSSVAKEPHGEPKPEEPSSEEYERFEEAVKRVLTVPKKDLDRAVERERQERQNGDGRSGNGSRK